MRGALAVSIDDGTKNRPVTQHVSGLSFTKIAPGGHQSTQMRLNVPRGYFADLGPADRLWIHDTRTAACIFSAYTENPTPVDGVTGQGYDITATGAMIRAADETRPLTYVDQSLDGWNEVDYGGNALASGQAGTYTDPDAGPEASGLRAQATSGSVVPTGKAVALDYRRLRDTGMKLAAVHAITQSGKNDTGYRAQFYDFISTTNIGDFYQISTVPYDQTQWVGVSIGDTDRCLLQIYRTGAATNVADDNTWTNFLAISVLGRRMDRTGTLLSTEAAHGSATSVLASQVVEDLLGRLLSFCDTATAVVEPTTVAIDQLAWAEGATAQRVLEELAQFEPDMNWMILDDGPGRGHRFAYYAWSPEPRYEITTLDGYAETGADVDLCNRVAVKWTDPAGVERTTIVTATSDDYPALLALEESNRVHDADAITLPAGKGSEANALLRGQQALAESAQPTRSAKATIRRPIRDLFTGAWVMPWEIEPGHLVRVRDIGINLRLTAMTYTDDSCSAALTLGTPVLTNEQRVLALARVA